MGIRRPSRSNVQIGVTGFTPQTRQGTKFKTDVDGLEASLSDLKQYRAYLLSLVEEGEKMMRQVAQVWDDDIHESYQRVWIQLREQLRRFEQELSPVCNYVERKAEEVRRAGTSHR